MFASPGSGLGQRHQRRWRERACRGQVREAYRNHRQKCQNKVTNMLTLLGSLTKLVYRIWEVVVLVRSPVPTCNQPGTSR
eukprot:16439817-Heterocapsa_arctica.AAC.1